MRIRTLRHASAMALALGLPLVALSSMAAETPSAARTAMVSTPAAPTGNQRACPDVAGGASPGQAGACATVQAAGATAEQAPSPAPSSWQERLAVVAAAVGAVVFLTMRQMASQGHGSPAGGTLARRPVRAQAPSGQATPAGRAAGEWRSDTVPGYLLSSFEPIDATTQPAVFDPLPSLPQQPAPGPTLSHAEARHPA